MRRIRIVATGGTIASRSGAEGRRATVLAKELVASVGPLPEGVEVDARDVRTRGSYAFNTGDLLALAREVRDALRVGADGVVMTHGTDTMEETAFLLDLAFDDPRPIVLTGAQRPFDDRAPDGPANLGDALAVAAGDAVAAGHPVLICSRVHSGPVVPLYAGGGTELRRVGVLFAGDLSPWQARLLLAAASAVPGRSPRELVRAWLAGQDPLSGVGS